MTTPALPVLVERWKRYGHDRAYVKIDGIQVGYRNLHNGDVQCERAEHREVIVRATEHLLPQPAGYLARHAVPVASSSGPAAQGPAAQPPAGATPAGAQTPAGAAPNVPAAAAVPAPSPSRPDPEPATALLPDRDLAINPPGGAARAQAAALREAAPIRTLFARALGARTDERAWRIGAVAEEEVGRRLNRLGPAWRTLHALPIGDRGSDIDHVVIGPPGVFTINTKHHPDASVWIAGNTFKVNGYNQPYIHNSRHEARRAARLLSDRAGFDVEVHGLIAVMGATRGFTVKHQPRDGLVWVVTRKGLVDYLLSLPPVLGEPSVTRIYDIARHLATWQPTTVGWAEFPH